MITIEEIEKRSEQGVLRPFLCLADNGRRYFVKGRGAGTANLIAEYVAGKLGRALKLPIPPCEIVRVPEELIRASAVEGVLDLGSGPAFGSEYVPFVQEVGAKHLTAIAPELKRMVLLFDWWIQNEDRSFKGAAGNPNLLWDTRCNALVVIDHNLAFDATFAARRFWETHIFSEERGALCAREFREAHQRLLAECCRMGRV